MLLVIAAVACSAVKPQPTITPTPTKPTNTPTPTGTLTKETEQVEGFKEEVALPPRGCLGSYGTILIAFACVAFLQVRKQP
jgi:hypothetical protein